MRSFALLLILLLSACSAYSQPTKQVCLPVAQAAKIADSLAVLPVVRREASAWQQASNSYQQAADSLRTADAAHVRACRALNAALQDERLVTANEMAKMDFWRHRARKRGLLNFLLATVVGGTTYLLFKP